MKLVFIVIWCFFWVKSIVRVFSSIDCRRGDYFVLLERFKGRVKDTCFGLIRVFYSLEEVFGYIRGGLK